jgi:hypothetical protein
MSIKNLKNLLDSFTDFEFLSSINSVNFETKHVDIKKSFFNRLIGVIKTHVNIQNPYQTSLLVNNVKHLYIRRLALVSTHSFFRYFLKNIKIAFQSFSKRLNRFFSSPSTLIQPPTEQRKARRQRKKKNKIVEVKTSQVPQQVVPSQFEKEESESEESESESESTSSKEEVFFEEGSRIPRRFPVLPPQYGRDERMFESEMTQEEEIFEYLNEYSEEESSIYNSDDESVLSADCIVGYGESDQII